MTNLPHNPKSPPRAPSARVTAALAAVTLALGVAVGAAIGPAPSPSFAVGQLLPLLPSLTGTAKSPTPTVSPPALPAPQTPAPARRASSTNRSTSASSATPPTGAETTAPASTTPTSTDKAKATTLPPVTKVWLIELAGSSFAEAAAQPPAAPYIDTQAVATGTLLSAWSAIDASAFANDATLIAGAPPQLLDTIVQPPCPASSPEGEGEGEGAAGSTASGAGGQCAPDTPGALTTADEFLKATLPMITATAPYRENGLIVVTFASIASATATGLPAGAATATLTSQPPAGALLISPFTKAGAKSSATFNPTAPKQSLEKLLRR